MLGRVLHHSESSREGGTRIRLSIPQIGKLRLRGRTGLEAAESGSTSGARDRLWAVRSFSPRGEASRSLSYRALNLVLKGGGELIAQGRWGGLRQEQGGGQPPGWSGQETCPEDVRLELDLDGWEAGGGQRRS